MSDFLAALGTELARLDLKGRLLVGVSGGADSVALLSGLAELRGEVALEIEAAHLDHMLRGEESAADALWVGQLCDKLSVPCVVDRADVIALRAGTNQTLEEAARRARYEFLERTAADRNCTEIALAHTADDQAETILHHILRGTGIAGLRGIPRQRRISAGRRIVRPLLEIRRAEIEAWLEERGQEYRDDASNRDPAFTRNRLRHELLPLLQKGYNPQVIPALLRLGQQAGELEEVLEKFAEDVLSDSILKQSPTRCQLRSEPLASQPLAFRRVCFTLLWQKQDWPRKRMTFAHWNRLAELVSQKRGALSLPSGLNAVRQGDEIRLGYEID